jgi:methionyl-tRNA formyltransferase
MMKKRSGDIRFAFFGTSHIAVFVLDALKDAGFMPALVITPPDKPRGRGLENTSVAAAQWARENEVELAHEWSDAFKKETWDVCIVVDYGILISKTVLEAPARGFLNIHPSLLPRLRGPSPIRSAILNDEKNTGVSIMLVDEELDHGPIVAQKRVAVPDWPPHLLDLERSLLREGGALLAQILPQWIAGEIDAQPQNHDVATYSEKIEKEDGLLNLNDDAYKNFLKIRAYEGWPGTFTFFERGGKKIRVKILDAHVENGKLKIDRVKPEGKGEMGYADFLRSGAKPTN